MKISSSCTLSLSFCILMYSNLILSPKHIFDIFGSGLRSHFVKSQIIVGQSALKINQSQKRTFQVPNLLQKFILSFFELQIQRIIFSNGVNFFPVLINLSEGLLNLLSQHIQHITLIDHLSAFYMKQLPGPEFKPLTPPKPWLVTGLFTMFMFTSLRIPVG